MSALESCPVCLNDETSCSRLKGCGHAICKECKNNLKKTNNQHILNNFDQKLVKCPMCRAIEKPSYQQLESQILWLLDEIDYKNRRIVQLCDGHLASMVPPRPPTQNVGLVGPRPATPGQVVAVMGLARAPRTRARANTNIPLMFCQRTDCRRKIRTRDRCRNHPETPCCTSCRWAGCNTCRAAMRNLVIAANPGPAANPVPATSH
jgi:hypothetical protein